MRIGSLIQLGRAREVLLNPQALPTGGHIQSAWRDLFPKREDPDFGVVLASHPGSRLLSPGQVESVPEVDSHFSELTWKTQALDAFRLDEIPKLPIPLQGVYNGDQTMVTVLASVPPLF